MRASLRWMQRYADLPSDPRLIADRLTMAGFVVAAAEHLAGGDVAFDVEVTHNRPDLLCHAGLARELAGIFGVEFRVPAAVPAADRSIPDLVPVSVEAPDLCPFYTARVVRGVAVGASPAWLAQALEAAGQRTVNNVVDVTNFVMLETGQPLHAFDLAKLRGPRIVVRRAQGEAFAAIDGSRLEVGAEDLAVCDAASPVALAGVMGGAESEVTGATRDVLLESAVFAPLAVRATSRRHQIRSESSHRFERRVDSAGVRAASDRAAVLFAEVCAASGIGPIVPAGPGEPPHAARIELRQARVARVLGLEVPGDEVVAILRSLGLRLDAGSSTPGVTAWTVPSWRPDLVAEIDLIEEVGRRVGFDRVPERTVLSVRPRGGDRGVEVRRRVRESLVRSGLRECISAPFVGEGAGDFAPLVPEPALRVLNPMRRGEDLLRRSLLGPLLATARRNAERDVRAVRLFESGPAYGAGDGPGRAAERTLVAGLVEGGYADAKGCVEALVLAVGATARFLKGAPHPFASGRSAAVHVEGVERAAGYLGEISPRTAARHGLAGTVAAFEVCIDDLTAAARFERPYVPVSRFPAVHRDLAWVVPERVTWGQVECIVRAAGGPLVRSVEFLSVFRSAQVGAGSKSLAFRMELRADDRTLTGDAADACVGAVIARLGAETGGSLRA